MDILLLIMGIIDVIGGILIAITVFTNTAPIPVLAVWIAFLLIVKGLVSILPALVS